jgi:hypothetical protein
LVALYGPLIAAALNVSVAALVAAFLASFASGAYSAVILQWLRAQGLQDALRTRLRPVLEQLWRAAWAAGEQAAGDVTGSQQPTMDQILEDLIRQYGSEWVDEIVNTRLEALAKALADSGSLSQAQIEALILKVLTDLSVATVIATTEVTRAMGAAAAEVYRLSGIEKVIWVTEDAKACPFCKANEAAGPQYLGTPFPSGAATPPQHVRCRCALLPYLEH